MLEKLGSHGYFCYSRYDPPFIEDAASVGRVYLEASGKYYSEKSDITPHCVYFTQDQSGPVLISIMSWGNYLIRDLISSL